MFEGDATTRERRATGASGRATGHATLPPRDVASWCGVTPRAYKLFILSLNQEDQQSTTLHLPICICASVNVIITHRHLKHNATTTHHRLCNTKANTSSARDIGSATTEASLEEVVIFYLLFIACRASSR